MPCPCVCPIIATAGARRQTAGKSPQARRSEKLAESGGVTFPVSFPIVTLHPNCYITSQLSHYRLIVRNPAWMYGCAQDNMGTCVPSKYQGVKGLRVALGPCRVAGFFCRTSSSGTSVELRPVAGASPPPPTRATSRCTGQVAIPFPEGRRRAVWASPRVPEPPTLALEFCRAAPEDARLNVWSL
jgi:hypothetical protein